MRHAYRDPRHIDAPQREAAVAPRAIVDGGWIYVSGVTGFDHAAMHLSDDLLVQTEQCMRNVDHALRQVQTRLKNVVRLTCTMPSAAEFEKCWPVMREYLGHLRSEAMMICLGRPEAASRIAIDVTARRPGLTSNGAQVNPCSR